MQYNKLVNTLLDVPTKEYPKRRFLLTKLLGCGAEGGAFLASASDWGNNPQQVVIKIQKNMKPNEKQFLSCLLEYQNLYENGNNQQYLPTYLIRIYENFQWQQNHCIVMEVGQEDLYSFINKSRNVSIQEKEQICFQIIYPILFLHQQKLIHRDIKPENYIKVGNVFKLIDFGLIRSSLSDDKTIQVGSTIFQAPEIIENRSDYTDKVDIWSLGCVFYEILATKPLFDGQTYQEVTNNIKSHKNYPVPVNNKINQLQISQQFKTILSSMLIYDEKKRPSIQQVYDQFKSYLNPQQKVIPQIIPKPDIPQQKQQQESNQQQQIKLQNTNCANKSENNSSEQQNQIIQNKELNQNQQQPKIDDVIKKDQIKSEEFNKSQLIQIQKIVDSMVESKLKETQNQLIQREQEIKQLNQKISDITNVMNKKQQEEQVNQNKINQINQGKFKEIESQVQSIQQQKSNNEKYNQDEKFQQFQSEIMIVQQQLKQIQQQQSLQNIEQQSQQKTQEIIQENNKLFKEQEVKLQEFLNKNIQEQNQQLTIKLDEIQKEFNKFKEQQMEINNRCLNIEQDNQKKQQEIQNITVQCEGINKTIYEIKIQQENLQNSQVKETQLNLSNQNRIDEKDKQISDIQNKQCILTNKNEDFEYHIFFILIQINKPTLSTQYKNNQYVLLEKFQIFQFLMLHYIRQFQINITLIKEFQFNINMNSVRVDTFILSINLNLFYKFQRLKTHENKIDNKEFS
ncbi:unnamed protein product [Paramecium primaurelia]|uniref:Protein kinase domain-containing protein n=1 Tax=Paramecium primaurelia TaxID=5886 RepID=A0A8S1PZ03_PARPR|nr:unnamed protein product [Paramecium primaurelia]